MSGHRIVTITLWPLAVSSKQLDALSEFLPAVDHRHVTTLRPDTARRFVASRGVARILLAERCGCSVDELEIRTDARGKPHLDHPHALAFNLSHSGDHCALAIGDVAAVGVDIEIVPAAIRDLVETVLSADEAIRFAAIPAADCPTAFIRAWVAKEAYLKATGDGLSGGLDSLEVDLHAGAEISPLAIKGRSSALADWQFEGFDVAPSVCGAVAINAGKSRVDVQFRRIDVQLALNSVGARRIRN